METGRGVSRFQNVVRVKNVVAAEDTRLAKHLVSPDALALVRFGLRAAEDPRILDTAIVVDALLKVETPSGAAWHRYNDDGYGEHEDGAPFDGTGVGRAWPLLSGERAHYELAAGRATAAKELLAAMGSFASEGGLISEQIWDSPDIPEHDLHFGRPSGSAMPLVWAHAEYLKLRRSLDDGRVFDLPPQPVRRYLTEATVSPRMVWRFNHKIRSLPGGKVLRIETLAAAVVHWSADGWRTVQDATTHDTGLAMHIADLPTQALPDGREINFTFYWPDADRWEGDGLQRSGRLIATGWSRLCRESEWIMENKANADGKYFVYLATAVSALGGMLFGYDIGVISGAILFIQKDFSLSPGMEEIVVSSVLLGSLIGAIGGGILADRLGRRRLLIVTAVVFGLGAIGAAVAPGTVWLIAGRLVAGTAIGIASFVAPLYISEIAPVAIRGKLVSINQVALTSGIVISYLVDYAFAGFEAWRWMFAMAVIPAAAFGIGLMFIPNSPRWLAARGHADQARAVLSRIRAPEKVDGELGEIQHSVAQQKGHWSELLSPLLRSAMIVGIGLAIAQQITGINTVIYYAPTIFKFAGLSSSSGAILASVGVGAVNVVLTIVAMLLIDRIGRRPLLLVSLAGMTLSLGRVGAGVFAVTIGRQPGLDRGGQSDGVCRLLCRGPGAGLLADTFGDLPVAHSRPGDERRDGRQLGRQLDRRLVLFDTHASAG